MDDRRRDIKVREYTYVLKFPKRRQDFRNFGLHDVYKYSVQYRI